MICNISTYYLLNIFDIVLYRYLYQYIVVVLQFHLGNKTSLK